MSRLTLLIVESSEVDEKELRFRSRTMPDCIVNCIDTDVTPILISSRFDFGG